jgi:hypothetical protein
VTEFKKSSLPSFITFDKTSQQLVLSPTSKTPIAKYALEILLTDSLGAFSSYKVTYEVGENSFTNR